MLEGQTETFRERLYEDGFGYARRVFEEDMAAGKEAGDSGLNDLGLSHHDLFHVGEDRCPDLGDLWAACSAPGGGESISVTLMLLPLL